ncbi:hypothetical protein GCM10008106_34690 [Mongoliitalea lutea]|uniref:Uncharacterized protein n=2 Tax=Mongoliitalea lutea TaxID=849756 RepID=A0A8J3D071_9BACT|nr:hypothetical protein GCM10008106_34690 [Mongoliitalea lutea]
MNKLLFLIIINIVISIYIDFIILTDDVFYSHFSEQYSYTRIGQMLEFRGKWLWVTYLITPVITFFKILIPASLVYLGFYLSNLKYPFSDVFKSCVIAEFVFLLPVLSKILWFEFVEPSFTLEEFNSFYPLSLFSLFDSSLLEKWFHYPFKALNVFEIGYWFALAGSLAFGLGQEFNQMLRIVVFYHGSFLVCWILFVVFISLSIY